MYGSLRKIVSRLTLDHALQKDMLQECLVCLWRVECEKPGRTRSWYLQNCRFTPSIGFASGRSVDSPKRARGDKLISLDAIDCGDVLDEHHTNGELFEPSASRIS